MKRRFVGAAQRFLEVLGSPVSKKKQYALAYWKERLELEGELSHDHYERFYTTHFGLDRNYYDGKKVLDIGCGPRGSLEWAETAGLRIGLDPLARAYRRLGAHRHQMDYVQAPAEAIPFADAYFDVVCSFNSLDHVDDIDRTVQEIVRVLTPGGLFLLLTDVHDKPTIREPQTFRWEVVAKFVPPLRLLDQTRFERVPSGIYQSVDAGVAYDSSDDTQRYGVLSAKFSKPQ